MSKCTACKKLEAEDTWWERTRRKLMFKLFPTDAIELSEEKYTYGFGEGYTVGFKHAQQNEKDKRISI